MTSRIARTALCFLTVVGGAYAQDTEDCSRTGIATAISAIPTTTLITGVINDLQLSAFLPGQRGEGTLFLPKNDALIALGVPLEDLTTTLRNQTIAILAYHSLLNKGETYDRSALLDNSPIDSDLAVIAAALGDDNQYALTFQPGPPPFNLEGREKVLGIRGSSTIRGVERICGYYVYPIDGVLVPAQTLAEVPPGAGAALTTALAQGAQLESPEGLGAALASSDVTLPATAIAAGRAADTAAPEAEAAEAPLGTQVAAAPDAGAPASADEDADSPDSDFDTVVGGGAIAGGAAGLADSPDADSPDADSPDDDSDSESPDEALGGIEGADGPLAEGPDGELSPSTAPAAASVTDGVAGAALPLIGANDTLTSSDPVILFGSVLAEDGTELGTGLVYIDGEVEDGEGVEGTATLIRRLDDDGITLSRQTVPLQGAEVTGAAISAEGFDVVESAAMGPAGMADGPSAMGPDEDDATGGFGEEITANEDGTLTNDGPFVLNGRVEDGTAVDEDTATGTAADGSLGPGLIYIDGEVRDGQGISGIAYPFVAQEGSAIAVNEENGVNIEDARISGTGFSSIGSEPRLQGADDEGGAGAASAGSPGVAEAGSGTSDTDSPDSDADAPTFPDLSDASAGTASASLLAVIAVAVAVLVAV